MKIQRLQALSLHVIYFSKLTTVRKMKSDIFKFAENSSHNFTWILIPFIKAGIYDIYVNSVTYIRVKMDSHTHAHIPIIFLMWCSMKLWPLTLQVTNSRPSRTNGFPHCKKKKMKFHLPKPAREKCTQSTLNLLLIKNKNRVIKWCSAFGLLPQTDQMIDKKSQY